MNKEKLKKLLITQPEEDVFKLCETMLDNLDEQSLACIINTAIAIGLAIGFRRGEDYGAKIAAKINE